MKRLLWIFIILLPLMGLGLLSSSAAPISWEAEQWTASETPYREAEKQVLQALNTKDEKQLRSVYARLEAKAEAQPTDAMAQFKQGVALSRLIRRGIDDLRKSRYLLERMSRLSPHSYMFARTRYLVERGHNHYSPDVRQVGRRLLKRSPDDYVVLYYQTTALDTRIPRERKESFAHAKRILKMRPNDYKSYYLMGDRYRALWVSSNVNSKAPVGKKWNGKQDKGNRDRAISYFRETQKFLPKDDPFRKGLDRAIKAMLEGRVV